MLRYQLCSTHYSAVQINNCFKRSFGIKVVTTDDFRKVTTDDFRNNGSHHVQSTLFMVNKDEWDTKKGSGKSMKNALYEQKKSTP